MSEIYFPYEHGGLQLTWKDRKLVQIKFQKRPTRLNNARIEAYQKDFLKQLSAYFAGKRLYFDVDYELNGTAFEKQVWMLTSKIPYGEVMTYAAIAKEIRRPRACRAVGGAMRKNPLPILIPCHRVIASSGSLQGFAGGLETKAYLLDLEAA